MRKIMAMAVITALVAATQAGEHRAYLYPSILQSGENLVEGDLSKWSGKNIEGCEMRLDKGTPFSRDGQALVVDANGTKPNYWGNGAWVTKGHTYLVGAWVKNDNAKILLWFYGNYGNPPKRLNERIYFFSGSSRVLDNYISDQVKARLDSDPDSWHLCYRLVEIPADADKFRLNMMAGTYFATGKITVANPFIIDVTGSVNEKMTVDVAGKKPIRSISIIALGVRDEVWRKNFDTPVTEFKQEIPDTHFKRGLDQKIFEGYLLKVEYTDDTTAVFTAPKEKTSKSVG